MWQRCLLSLWDGPPALWECAEQERVSVRETEHKDSGDLTLALSPRRELASSLEKSINPFFKRFLKLASMLLYIIMQLILLIPPALCQPLGSTLYQHLPAHSHIHIHT